MVCKQRLRKNSEFSAVYEHGSTRANDLVVLKTLSNGLEYNRYGFVAGKRLGKAVVRNRVKRILREVIRTIPATPGWDVVLIARSRAATSNFEEMKTSVTGLMHRARILAVEDKVERTQKAPE